MEIFHRKRKIYSAFFVIIVNNDFTDVEVVVNKTRYMIAATAIQNHESEGIIIKTGKIVDGKYSGNVFTVSGDSTTLTDATIEDLVYINNSAKDATITFKGTMNNIVLALNHGTNTSYRAISDFPKVGTYKLYFNIVYGFLDLNISGSPSYYNIGADRTYYSLPPEIDGKSIISNGKYTGIAYMGNTPIMLEDFSINYFDLHANNNGSTLTFVPYNDNVEYNDDSSDLLVSVKDIKNTIEDTTDIEIDQLFLESLCEWASHDDFTEITEFPYYATNGLCYDMSAMFSSCTKLTSLNLTSFNTERVASFDMMFDGCQSLTSLDLSGFNTCKAINLEMMFFGCTSLRILDISNFNTYSVSEMSYMFYGCSSLEYLIINSAKFVPCTPSRYNRINNEQMFNRVPSTAVLIDVAENPITSKPSYGPLSQWTGTFAKASDYTITRSNGQVIVVAK